jgi:hypothetical protein
MVLAGGLFGLPPFRLSRLGAIVLGDIKAFLIESADIRRQTLYRLRRRVAVPAAHFLVGLRDDLFFSTMFFVSQV